MAICAESSNHIVVNAFLLAFYLRCIEQNGGEGGAAKKVVKSLYLSFRLT